MTRIALSLLLLVATGCGTLTATRRQEANNCMRRCTAQRGPEQPITEVSPSGQSLVPWHATDSCERRCAWPPVGDRPSDQPTEAPRPFEPSRGPGEGPASEPSETSAGFR